MSETKRKYDDSALLNAYVCVKTKGEAIRSAARKFGVPESTLRSRIHNPCLLDCSKVGRPRIFTHKEEAMLADHLKEMTRSGYGYTRTQVCEMASNMAIGLGRQEDPKKDWYYGFVDRFPDLAIQRSKKRELASTRETNIKNFFQDLETILNKYELKDKPEAIWYVDETSITLDPTLPKIVSSNGDKSVVESPSESVTTSVIAASNAKGQTLPPYVIYKGQRLTADITSGCLPETKFAMTPYGLSTSLTFQDFIKNHFITRVKSKPCILLYDGHSTHISPNLIAFARDKDVHMSVLPPSSSQLLQPVDVGIFIPFKASLSAECHVLSHSQMGRQVTRSDLPEIIVGAYHSAFTTSNLMNAFHKTGIVPFNPDAITLKPPSPLSMEVAKSQKAHTSINLLLKEGEIKVESSSSTSPQKTKKNVVQPCDAVTTETEVQEKQNEREDKNKKGLKRKENESNDRKSKGKKKVCNLDSDIVPPSVTQVVEIHFKSENYRPSESAKDGDSF